jgi:nucleotide-binding universal stress UspA family protein
VDHARVLARWYDATLTVMEVVWSGLPPTVVPGVAATAVPPADRDAGLEQLRAFCGADAATDVRLNTVVREGAVVPQILEQARAIEADLIVMGTHGHGGFDRLLLGSVAEKTLHKADCPVMTVPPASSPPRDASRPFATIVCAMDFSPASYAALNHALSIAQEAEAAVSLVHVIDAPRDGPIPAGRGPEVAADRRLQQSAAQRELRLAVPEDARNWCRIEESVRIGRPHEEIVALATERGADLIVLGVHGRTGIRRPFVGSTTNQIVRHATCPVLTVR